MFVIKAKSLYGSTIVEVVTGVFLISLAMALSIVVFTKTMDNSNLYVRHQAVNKVNELIVEQTKAVNFIASQVDLGDIQIMSSVASFTGNDSLQIMLYSAKLISTGKEIYRRRLVKK
jgi:hypothetical protein